MGPFHSRFARILTSFILKRVDLITVRETLSNKIVKEAGIKNRNTFETADLAFTIPSVSAQVINRILQVEHIPTNGILVGISASRLVAKWFQGRNGGSSYEDYVLFMAAIVKHVNDRLGAVAVFIPHVFGPEKDDDDRIVAEDICQKLSNNDMVRIVRREYSPSELKGIIGKCDIFIGTRTHALISAISSYVPSLAISYLHKTEGIMDSVNQGHWVFPMEGIDQDEIVARIDDLYARKSYISADLRKKMDDVKKKAFLNGELVQKLLRV